MAKQEQEQGLVDERTVAVEQAKMSAKANGYELTDAEAEAVVARVEAGVTGPATVTLDGAKELKRTAQRLQAAGFDPDAEEQPKAAAAVMANGDVQVSGAYDYGTRTGELPLRVQVARAMAERPQQDLKEPFLVGLPAKEAGESWEQFSGRQGELLATALHLLAASAVEQGGVLRLTLNALRTLERGTSITFPARLEAESDAYVVASGPTVRPADPGPVAFPGGAISVRIAHVTSTAAVAV